MAPRRGSIARTLKSLVAGAAIVVAVGFGWLHWREFAVVVRPEGFLVGRWRLDTAEVRLGSSPVGEGDLGRLMLGVQRLLLGDDLPGMTLRSNGTLELGTGQRRAGEVAASDARMTYTAENGTLLIHPVHGTAIRMSYRFDGPDRLIVGRDRDGTPLVLPYDRVAE